MGVQGYFYKGNINIAGILDAVNNYQVRDTSKLVKLYDANKDYPLIKEF